MRAELVRVSVIVLMASIILFAGCFVIFDSYSKEQNREAIQRQAKAFSAAYMQEDIEALTGFYWEEAIITPGGRDHIKGHKNIKAYWQLPPGVEVTLHQSRSEKLDIRGSIATDYGFYSGKTLTNNSEERTFSGQYVIAWEKRDQSWKMSLDMWAARSPEKRDEMIPEIDFLNNGQTFLVKPFHGELKETSSFLQSVQKEINKLGIETNPYVAISVYGSVSKQSLQGVEVSDSFTSIPEGFKRFRMKKGEYVRCKFTGDPAEKMQYAVEATNLWSEQRDIPISDEKILYAGYENEEVFFIVYRKIETDSSH